jgi:hypothetical protein
MYLRASDPMRAFARLVLVAVAALAITGAASRPAQAATARPVHATVLPIRVAQEPPREPVFGICLRPALFKVIDLPGLNLPAERIPWEPIAIVFLGQFRDCHP